MWHSVQVTVTPAPPDGQLESESTVWTCLADGNCKREIARDQAQNAIRFGPWQRARVFAGKSIGRLIYECQALPEAPEIETPEDRAHARAY